MQWHTHEREPPSLPDEQGVKLVYSPKLYPITGMDTETRHGNVHLIADDESNILLDPHEPIPLNDLLNFMHRPKRTVLWYNMQYDMECILKQLPENALAFLWKGSPIEHEGFHIKAFLPKFVSIRKGRYATKHYDVAQFYGERLEDAAKRHLGTGKLPDIDAATLGKNKAYWLRNLTDTQLYCIRDAMLTKALGETWQALMEGVDLPVSFISSANAAGLWMARYGLNDRANLREDVQLIAWKAYYGGRFETRVKGTIPHAYGYDLNSAYPAAWASLPDPRDCVWLQTTDPYDLDQAYWGFVHASYDVPMMDWAPLPVRHGPTRVLFPVGRIAPAWYTLWEHRAAVEAGCEANVLDAWVARDPGPRRFGFVAEAWNLKEKLRRENDPRAKAVKVVANGGYGKLIERRPAKREWRRVRSSKLPYDAVMVNGEWWAPVGQEWEAGPLYDAVTAAHITAKVRLQCYEIARKYDTASIATDGVITLEPLPDHELAPRELGGWAKEAEGRCLIVGNGLYQIADKSRTRGVKKTTNKFDWFDAIGNMKPGAWVLRTKRERPVHPGECMTKTKLAIKDVGVFRVEHKKFNLNDDHKRKFPRVTAKKLLEDNYIGRPLYPEEAS